MKLKIISDGTSFGTKIIDSTTGEEVEEITSIRWEITAGEVSRATITFDRIQCVVEGEVIDDPSAD